MMPARPPNKEIPLLIHVVNVAALLLAGLLLLLTAVVRAYQVVVLVPVLVLLVVYWRFRTDPRVAAGYFGLALALLGWILICEHIVTVDNVLGTQISQRLELGLRLQRYVQTTLHTGDLIERQACCGDPLTWHYRPGSRYRKTFDCPRCNEPYEIVVDETGYLNQPAGLWQSHEQIDLFLAGDSVLQGFGVPSVVEWVRTQIPLRMWNLSISAYGPRQKINALLTYALLKSPQWLVVEFYSGNDVAEAIRDELCRNGADFRCRHNAPELRRRLAQHPAYPPIFEAPTGVWATLVDYSAESLTLATTRYLLDVMKGALIQRLAALVNPSRGRDPALGVSKTIVPLGAQPLLPLRQGQELAYLQAGMALTFQDYKRLWATLEGRAPKPEVILLYNPTPYEVYRGIMADPNPEVDRRSAFQREALSAFAHAHGWRFLDLTDPSRQAVQARQVWLFGRYDRSHWSPQGTAIVADVLGSELRTVIGPGELKKMGLKRPNR